MALSMNQLTVGTVVEHFYHVDVRTGKTKQRNPIRRGVIHHLEDDVETGGVGIWVQFKREGGAEKVLAAEMNVVHGPTKETLRIVAPTAESPNEFLVRDNPAVKDRIVIENELKVGRPVRGGKVAQD